MAKQKQHNFALMHFFVAVVVALIFLGAGYGLVQATLVSGPSIISAPAVIADDTPGATNDQQQAFDEQLSVTLSGPVQCDKVILPAGETVNSHMIFYNTPGVGLTSDLNRTWTFKADIVCVMSGALHQALTDNMLGAPGTSYLGGPFVGRGLENNDSYSVNGNQITVSMTAEEPGDWIRVLTTSSQPQDTTAPVVYCDTLKDTSSDKNQGKAGDKMLELIGADDTDGAVDIYLTDTATGEQLGPFTPGTTIRHTVSNGQKTDATAAKNNVDYDVRTQGSMLIQATDVAGNNAEAACGA